MKDRFTMDMPEAEAVRGKFPMAEPIIKFLRENPGKFFMVSSEMCFTGKELQIIDIKFNECETPQSS